MEFPIFDHNDRIFDMVELSGYEQEHIRGKPIKYIKYTIDLFKKHTNANVILEVGSIRKVMEHPIEEFYPSCCNDGHSTYFWKKYTDAEIYTVDIDPRCKTIIENDDRLEGVFSYTQDAVEFLSSFDKMVDLLFLDAWDVIADTPYAEEHLNAYNIIKPKLSEKCLILIDDTDIAKGGKGRLLVPKLIDDGFKMLISGRQTLFVR